MKMKQCESLQQRVCYSAQGSKGQWGVDSAVRGRQNDLSACSL